MNKKIIAIVCSLLVIITVGVIFKIVTNEKKDKVSISTKEKLENTKFPSEKDGFIQIDLYFDEGKEPESNIVKEERLVNKEELVGEIIIQELIKGPAVVSSSKPVLPKETRLLSFSINEGTAYINLNSNAQFDMTADKERVLLSSISSSLTQLPSVQKIMITVENKNIETLGGNYNISKPFGKEEIDSLKIQK
ncbi:GerMN domain-containing protein [Clostridium sp.]|uniref:GerMN domain-containing protein n=1 Tax=Clostridium sp. TaxID=1506 RepID=UPI002FCBE37C